MTSDTSSLTKQLTLLFALSLWIFVVFASNSCRQQAVELLPLLACRSAFFAVYCLLPTAGYLIAEGHAAGHIEVAAAYHSNCRRSGWKAYLSRQESRYRRGACRFGEKLGAL